MYNYLLAEQHFQKSIEIVEERGDIQQQVDTFIDYSGKYKDCIEYAELYKKYHEYIVVSSNIK